MIRITDNLRTTLDFGYPRVFPEGPNRRNVNVYSPSEITLYNNTLFERQLSVDLSKNTIEIPVNMLKYLVHNILTRDITHIPEEIIMPLSLTINYPFNNKSPYGIIKELTLFTYAMDGLIKINSDKYGVFYANNSLMLDSEFNVIYYRAYKINSSIQEVKRNFDRNTFLRQYCTPVFYVNPDKYLEKEDAMSKYMVNTMIPYYLYRGNVEVLFNKCEDLIVTPIQTIATNVNYNEIISENLVILNDNVIFEI